MNETTHAALTSAIERIRAALGEAACLTSTAETAPYLVDFRRLYQGKTRLVVCPATTSEVATVLAICNDLRVGVVPHGGNTGYCGGATPDESGSQIVLSLRRMNRIRSIDADNFAITAEAGCVLADLQQAAASVDRIFPLELGSAGSCQIGGNLSTNAGGLNALRYGVTRDLALGLEVVLADGRIIDGLTSLRKDNTGYDLRHMFIGAEGTLGVITAASLKLYPQPRTVETAWVAVRDPAAAVQLLTRLRADTGDLVTTFEYVPRLALDFVLRHVSGTLDPLAAPYGHYVLCEVSTSRDDPALREQFESLLHYAVTSGLAHDAVLARSTAQRDALWRLRESIPEGQRHEGASIKHDVSVPVAALPDFLAEASAAVLAVVPDARLVTYGHVGDGNLHFNLSEPAGGDRSTFIARTADIHNAVYERVRAYRGSISAEHGIGRLKRDELAHWESPAALSVMRALKAALDPRGIMNPGKVLAAD